MVLEKKIFGKEVNIFLTKKNFLKNQLLTKKFKKKNNQKINQVSKYLKNSKSQFSKKVTCVVLKKNGRKEFNKKTVMGKTYKIL